MNIPKLGSITEYQSSYHNLREIDRPAQVKLKDTLSFGNKRLLSDPSYISNNNNNNNNNQSSSSSYDFSTNHQVRRLYNMMPENSLSWYKGDYGFYGNNQKNESPRVTREPYNSLNHYKSDHIRRFDELNNGLVDSYSLSKGAALLSIRNQQENGMLKLENSDFNSNSYDQKYHSRLHDLRSVWIPKKFEGRNMFASHIDSTIFPDKAKNKPLITQYNQNYDFTTDAKKQFEKPTYDKIDKSVRYSVSHDNKLIPNIIWQPHKITERYRTEPVESNPNPFRSSYQTDFDSPSLLQKVNSKINNNQQLNENGFELKKTYDLKKRQNEIDQELLKLNY